MPSPIWYDDDKYWVRGEKARNEADTPKIHLIVAEAERRTWEAAKKKIESSQMSICRSGELTWGDVDTALKLFKRAVSMAFEAKIKSLSRDNKGKRKV